MPGGCWRQPAPKVTPRAPKVTRCSALWALLFRPPGAAARPKSGTPGAPSSMMFCVLGLVFWVPGRFGETQKWHPESPKLHDILHFGPCLLGPRGRQRRDPKGAPREPKVARYYAFWGPFFGSPRDPKKTEFKSLSQCGVSGGGRPGRVGSP